MRKFFFLRHNTFAVWIEQPPTNFLSSLNSEGGKRVSFGANPSPKVSKQNAFQVPVFRGKRIEAKRKYNPVNSLLFFRIERGKFKWPDSRRI